MTLETQFNLLNEAATEALGRQLADGVPPGAIIYLHGDLGVGKTTLMRGVLRGLAFEGKVKSPTYTLVEPYACPGHALYHFDLYRLNTPSELEQIGFSDYLDGVSSCWFEWPEKGAGVLPNPDLTCTLVYHGEGREAHLKASTEKGQHWLQSLMSAGVGKLPE